jgi:hypothetical protein
VSPNSRNGAQCGGPPRSGSAAGNISLEATSRGCRAPDDRALPDKARTVQHPEGKAAPRPSRRDPSVLPDPLKQRDLPPQPQTLKEFVCGKWERRRPCLCNLIPTLSQCRATCPSMAVLMMNLRYPCLPPEWFHGLTDLRCSVILRRPFENGLPIYMTHRGTQVARPNALDAKGPAHTVFCLSRHALRTAPFRFHSPYSAKWILLSPCGHDIRPRPDERFLRAGAGFARRARP